MGRNKMKTLKIYNNQFKNKKALTKDSPIDKTLMGKNQTKDSRADKTLMGKNQTKNSQDDKPF